jgi:hypothetical protein
LLRETSHAAYKILALRQPGGRAHFLSGQAVES